MISLDGKHLPVLQGPDPGELEGLRESRFPRYLSFASHQWLPQSRTRRKSRTILHCGGRGFQLPVKNVKKTLSCQAENYYVDQDNAELIVVWALHFLNIQGEFLVCIDTVVFATCLLGVPLACPESLLSKSIFQVDKFCFVKSRKVLIQIQDIGIVTEIWLGCRIFSVY